MVWAKGVLGLGLRSMRPSSTDRLWSEVWNYQCIMWIPVVFITLTPSCLECSDESPACFSVLQELVMGVLNPMVLHIKVTVLEMGYVSRHAAPLDGWCKRPAPFGSLTLSSCKSLCQIMRWNFLIMPLFRYDWPSFRTTDVCTGVCLNVTSVFCFNKAVDIWTLCD